MKSISLLLAVLFSLALGIAPGRAAVGYVNHTFPSGDSLIANPLHSGDDTLSGLFPGGPGSPIPNGTTITLWNPATQTFLAPSAYDQISGWTINYALPPGLGALMHAPSQFPYTFVGEVVELAPTPPPAGLYLLASQNPINNATFLQTIGRAPLEGESFRRLDNPPGTYFTTTFHAGGGGWDNGEPALPIAEAAFFTLVPEPGTIGLGLVGVAMLFFTRRIARASRR